MYGTDHFFLKHPKENASFGMVTNRHNDVKYIIAIHNKFSKQMKYRTNNLVTRGEKELKMTMQNMGSIRQNKYIKTTHSRTISYFLFSYFLFQNEGIIIGGYFCIFCFFSTYWRWGWRFPFKKGNLVKIIYKTITYIFWIIILLNHNRK